MSVLSILYGIVLLLTFDWLGKNDLDGRDSLVSFRLFLTDLVTSIQNVVWHRTVNSILHHQLFKKYLSIFREAPLPQHLGFGPRKKTPDTGMSLPEWLELWLPLRPPLGSWPLVGRTSSSGRRNASAPLQAVHQTYFYLALTWGLLGCCSGQGFEASNVTAWWSLLTNESQER